MPLRPIDAIFVQPERRCYVIYHAGELWQLTRMKLDEASWWRRRPYQGDLDVLYLSQNQVIEDPKLAAILRTLDLPKNLHGTSFPKFKDWWRSHGFDWLKNIIVQGNSPLAGHSRQNATAPATIAGKTDNDNKNKTLADANTTDDKPASTADNTTTAAAVAITGEATKKTAGQAEVNEQTTKTTSAPKQPIEPKKDEQPKPASKPKAATGSIFDDMLADLTDEVLGSR